MLLSEMLGVERGEPFMVRGLEGVFGVDALPDEIEFMRVREGHGGWSAASKVELYKAIHSAPAGIIHLPPPLTDEQREQLKAIWTLGGRWLAKDADRDVYAYSVKPEQDSDWAEWVPIKYDEDELQFTIYRDLDVCGLVSWSDPEPFDIGKALGVGE